MKGKTKELICILVYYIVVALFVVYFKLGYLTSAFLFLAVPSIYLSARRPAIIKKTFFYSFLLTPPIAIVVDYMAHVSKAWYEASTTGIRILDSFPIEAFLWGFLYLFFNIAFYEYFFDHDRNKRRLFFKNTKYLFYIVFSALFIFSLIYFFSKELLVIEYFYIWFIFIGFVMPTVAILYKYPRIFEKIVRQGIYFFVLLAVYDLAGTYTHQWSFFGKQYIGFVELFGVRLPFEELLWWVLAVPAVLCVYEFFIDDTK